MASTNRLDTAVLDIDGTLLDSCYHHALAWSRAFDATLDHHVPVVELHRAIGMGGDRLVAHVAGDEVEQRHGDELRKRWKQEYDEVIDQTRLVPGARELLDALQRRGLDVVLASSSIPEHARHALDLLDAERRADAATTSEDAEESKPDPELLETALDKVGGGRALMIGDAVWDVEAARRIGVPTVALLSGGTGAEELLAAGAFRVLRDCAELVERLDEVLGSLADA